MMIELEYAKNPVMQATGIELVCKFTHLDVEVPFFAMADDPEQYGREIFKRAIAGEFGEVAPFIPPTPNEIAARENPKRRQSEMIHATTMAQHHSMMGDQQLAGYWCSYYRLVYEMAQAPQWPLVSAWPTRPE